MTDALEALSAELQRQNTLQKQAVSLGLIERPKVVDRADFYKSKQIELLESIKSKEDRIAELQDEIRTHKVHMMRVRDLDAEDKFNSKPSWETTGYNVLPYRDPQMTGLSKRTPSGGFFSS